MLIPGLARDGRVVEWQDAGTLQLRTMGTPMAPFPENASSILAVPNFFTCHSPCMNGTMIVSDRGHGGSPFTLSVHLI